MALTLASVLALALALASVLALALALAVVVAGERHGPLCGCQCLLLCVCA
jgi:hypothetical protein